MAEEVRAYVPGYRLRSAPQFDDGVDLPGPVGGVGGRVTVFLEVEGAGSYLPKYSGNLDIMTAAATKVGEEIATSLGFAAAAAAGAERGS